MGRYHKVTTRVVRRMSWLPPMGLLALFPSGDTNDAAPDMPTPLVAVPPVLFVLLSLEDCLEAEGTGDKKLLLAVSVVVSVVVVSVSVVVVVVADEEVVPAAVLVAVAGDARGKVLDSGVCTRAFLRLDMVNFQSKMMQGSTQSFSINIFLFFLF